MKKAVWAAALALAVSFAAGGAVAAETMHLASHYAVHGKNANGTSYSGVADIEILSDTTFSIDWKIKGSGDSHGFGMRMNNTVSATYMLAGQPGLIIYKTAPDGSFSGIWAIRGGNGNGSETLTPLP